jgi:hypothetical protein
MRPQSMIPVDNKAQTASKPTLLYAKTTNRCEIQKFPTEKITYTHFTIRKQRWNMPKQATSCTQCNFPYSQKHQKHSYPHLAAKTRSRRRCPLIHRQSNRRSQRSRRIRVRIRLHHAGKPNAVQEKKVATSPFALYMPKLIQKGYMVLMLLACVCGCNVMQGDRQIQDGF